jgi:hypothetical protein
MKRKRKEEGSPREEPSSFEKQVRINRMESERLKCLLVATAAFRA